MHRMVGLAAKHNVGVGAHPGFRDMAGFGRRHINATDDELSNDFVYRVGALSGFAALHGVKLQHVKPHGALYMHVAKTESLSRALISALQKIDANLYLYYMASSVTASVAKAMGQPVVLEFYADRDYDLSGSIVFTRRVGALDPAAVAAKVLRACSEGVVATVEGGTIAIDFDSVCIHSDTPGALALVRATRDVLARNHITLAAPRALRSS